jgi:hypothetical protein
VVYAHLAAGCAGDPEARKRLDEDLYAPLGGWDNAERKLMALIAAAPDLET